MFEEPKTETRQLVHMFQKMPGRVACKIASLLAKVVFADFMSQLFMTNNFLGGVFTNFFGLLSDFGQGCQWQVTSCAGLL